jgi:hypothetical protein
MKRKPITSGPAKQAISQLTEVSAKAAQIALEQLKDDRQIPEDLQRFNSNGDKLISRLIPFFKKQVRELSQLWRGNLVCVSEGMHLGIGTTKNEAFAADPYGIFDNVDSEFTRQGFTNIPYNVVSSPALIDVYETTERSEFGDLFSPFWDTASLTQSQIMRFLTDNPLVEPQVRGRLYYFLLKHPANETLVAVEVEPFVTRNRFRVRLLTNFKHSLATADNGAGHRHRVIVRTR